MTDYNKLKVTELKEILKERGIPSTGLGRKAQIIEALEKYDREAAAAAEDGGDEGGEAEGVVEAEAVPESQAVEEEQKRGEDATLEQPQDEATAAAPVEDPSIPVPTSAPTETIPTTASHGQAEQPIVLEQNQPVSKEPSALNTPQQRSFPAAESVSSDTRKRKRRSPTPPLSQESVNKKLKAAEDGDGMVDVKLPEDIEVEKGEETKEEGPVAVERNAEAEGVEGVPDARDEDVMEVDASTEAAAPAAAVVEGVGESAPTVTGLSRHPPEPETQPISRSTDLDDSDQPPTVPAIHPATRALYIRDLIRPLQPNQLRTYLITLATPPSSSNPDESILELFHLDTLRTHAFAVFTSLPAAARVRSALHGRVWPDEPARRALWVDFVPEEKVKEWIDTEERGGGSKRDAKKWEVVYSPTEENGSVEAKLQEVSSGTGGGPPTGPRQMSFSGPSSAPPSAQQGQGMPNAPLGPRGRQPSYQQPTAPSRSPPAATKPTPAPQETASFTNLNARFPSTTTKPKLYYLPANPSLVSARLAALAAITSAKWDGEREGSFGRDGGGGAGELVRRYTFEDGDGEKGVRVVDGGGDIGNFGRPGRGGVSGGGGSFGGRGRGRR